MRLRRQVLRGEKMANLSKALGQPESVAVGDLSEVMRVLALLTEALAVCDNLGFPPEVGARIEELIDRIEQEMDDRELAEAVVRAFSSGSATG